MEEESVDMHLQSAAKPGTFYSAALLPQGYVALATLKDKGIYIIDQFGTLIEALDEDRNVPADVNFSFTDRWGGVMVSTR